MSWPLSFLVADLTGVPGLVVAGFVSATQSVRARGTAMDELAVNARVFLDAPNKKRTRKP